MNSKAKPRRLTQAELEKLRPGDGDVRAITYKGNAIWKPGMSEEESKRRLALELEKDRRSRQRKDGSGGAA